MIIPQSLNGKITHQKRSRFFIPCAVMGGLFIFSRLYLLIFFEPLGSDATLYARYAYCYQFAAEKHLSFHDVYRTSGLAKAGKEAAQSPASYALTVIAYPPLAVAFMNIPTFMARGGKSITLIKYSDFSARYQKAYRWLCAILEMVCFIITCFLIIKIYGNERTANGTVRMGVIGFAGLLMPHILYDRLDIILSVLIVLSLTMLLNRSMWLAFFLFAVSVNYKIIPLFLLPIWVLGSFGGDDFLNKDTRKTIIDLFKIGALRCIIMCTMIFGIFAFFLFTEGIGVLDFLSNLFDPRVHIESSWGAFSLLVARLFHTAIQIIPGYGRYSVVTPATPVFSQLSFPVLVLALFALPAILAIRLLSWLSKMIEGKTVFLGQQSIIEASLCTLLMVFSFSKIFSPQYLLILIPFVALAPYSGKIHIVFSIVFAAVCLLSTIIFPYYYLTDIIKGPSWVGLVLIVSRMSFLLGLTGFSFVHMVSERNN